MALRVRRGVNLPIGNQPSQECLDLDLAHFAGLAYLVNMNQRLDLVDVNRFCAGSKVLMTNSLARMVEQSRGLQRSRVGC